MKQLFNEISGRSLDIAFAEGTTNEQIVKWVNQNLDEVENLGLDFQEIESCEAILSIEDGVIEINGDEDLAFLRIRQLTVIGHHANSEGLIS